MKLEYHVTLRNELAVVEIADPMVRKIGPDQHQLPSGKRVDAVTNDEATTAISDEMYLVLRMVIPP